MRKRKEPDWTVLDEITQDFSDDECVRRRDELIRRVGRMKQTFDMNTGQPFEGPQLTPDELARRGY